MSFEEIQNFLLNHNLSPNKLLGQNFMVEPSFYPKLAHYSNLGGSDVVLDAGAGFGFFARFLSGRCRGVVAVEKDPQVALALRDHVSDLSNVTVVEGDVLKTELPAFGKVISAPPYYLSTQLVTWLLAREVACAVLVVQREFAERLDAPVGSEGYSWLTVAVAQRFRVELLDAVSKDCFYPQPEVDSVIMRLTPWKIQPFTVKNQTEFMQFTKSLFTERNRKLAKAAVPYLRTTKKMGKLQAEEAAQNLPYAQMRPRELTPKQFGEVADALSN